MLTLPIKGKWMFMIRHGGKEEEYREVKPYYTKRFQSVGLLDENGKPTGAEATIKLRNGYGEDRPDLIVRVSLKCGEGREEWGAVPGVVYYVLCIKQFWYDDKEEYDPTAWSRD